MASKEYPCVISLRMSTEMVQQLKTLADYDDRPVGVYVRRLISAHLGDPKTQATLEIAEAHADLLRLRLAT